MVPISYLTLSGDFVAGLLPDNPRCGYLFAAAILLVWLVGVVCGWKWTYARPGSYGGNLLLNLLGPKTFRLLLGILLVVILTLVLYLFFSTK